MFESKVPLCLFGEFIALPKPSQTSNDRAETSPEGGVASTALRRNGEWATRRNGETAMRWPKAPDPVGRRTRRAEFFAPPGQGLWSSRPPFAYSPFRLFAAELRFSLFARKYAV